MTASNIGRAQGRIKRGAPQAAGFTLIEVMVVTVLLAILAAIALPNYQQYVRRAHRAEARTGLLQAAHWMERVATASGRYITEAEIEAGAFPAFLATVASRTYQIHAEGDADGRSFRLQAVPIGNQTRDRCGTFVLTHSGHRSLADSADSDALVGECWGR